MEITREFLQAEVAKWQGERQRAHEYAIAAQAAVDTLTAMLARLDATDDTPTFADLGLPDPEPLESTDGLRPV